jgi:ribonuclease HI
MTVRKEYTVGSAFESALSEAEGLVLYIDGSFRRQVTGWGIHGYAYKATPLTRGIGIKSLPTKEGYDKVEYPGTVTPLFYIDAFGRVNGSQSNNVGELQAAVEGIRLARHYEVKTLTLRLDSEYVRKGITGWVKRWAKNGWKTTTGNDVANRELWEALQKEEADFQAIGGKITWTWVKGHSGCPGNDQADLNAKNGGGVTAPFIKRESDPQGYHNPKNDHNPLILKTRMVFSIGGKSLPNDMGQFYYFYHLGAMSNYAHKKEDSLLTRHAKTDLLLGRRIADASFCVMRLDEPDVFLELLKTQHEQAHVRDVVDLVKVRLDHAFKPAVKQRILTLGTTGLIVNPMNRSITTVQDELVSITIDPPGLAMEGVDVFNGMQRQLTDHLAGKEGRGIMKVDVTDQLYVEELKGKKDPKPVLKLKPEIVNGLAKWIFRFEHKGKARQLPALLGVDLPERNTLARLADHKPKVTLFLIAGGPFSYSFGFIIETEVGDILYQSPYTNFLIPKE